ncbi:hypothetical protein C4K26_5668 [Pseudomonas chlororaphis]|nr:hypothetical protein C4K26_5668 [Pseudomonas chlororaphis]
MRGCDKARRAFEGLKSASRSGPIAAFGSGYRFIDRPI